MEHIVQTLVVTRDEGDIAGDSKAMGRSDKKIIRDAAIGQSDLSIWERGALSRPEDGCVPGIAGKPTVIDTNLETWTLADGTPLKMRNITPADAAIEQAFVRGLSPQTRYFRFHGTVKELSNKQLHDLTCLDPGVSTAFIVLFERGKSEEEIAVARYIIDRDGTGCEIAIVVGDAWQRRGVGTRLMNALIEHARAQGITRIYDFVLKSNRAMREWSERLGFRESRSPDDSSVVVVTKVLTAPTQ